MLDVLCGEVELGEYGEVLRVGDLVRRLGVRRRSSWFGTGLDDIDLWFDRYAGIVGVEQPITIVGEVDAIASVYTRLAKNSDGSWVPRAGSTTVESLMSTADTRRPIRRIIWTASPRLTSSQRGTWGSAHLREGDESLWGWRITLAAAAIETADRSS